MANTDTKKPFKKLTYRLAIIAKCRTCCCGSVKEVKLCSAKSCPLWYFRMGKQPKEPVNALDLTVFEDDPNSKIFRIRRGSSEDDDPVTVDKEYSSFFDDEDDE